MKFKIYNSKFKQQNAKIKNSNSNIQTLKHSKFKTLELKVLKSKLKIQN